MKDLSLNFMLLSFYLFFTVLLQEFPEANNKIENNCFLNLEGRNLFEALNRGHKGYLEEKSANLFFNTKKLHIEMLNMYPSRHTDTEWNSF